MLKANTTKGKLIVVEGIDGSGKSAQIDLLYKWFTIPGYSVFFSEWNSSPLVKSTAKGSKKKKPLPLPPSAFYITDFADRWENSIYPLLKAGAIVLADRYVFTAFAQDVARGWTLVGAQHVFIRHHPTDNLYFRVPLDVAVERITATRASLKYYEAGMDLNLSDNINESFKLFRDRSWTNMIRWRTSSA